MIRINLLKTEKKEIKEIPPGFSVGPEKEKKVKKKKETDEFAEPLEKPKKKIPVNLIILLGIVLIVALLFAQKKSLDKEKRLLSEAQGEKAKLKNVTTMLQQFEQRKSLFERKIQLITELQSKQDISVKILDELSRNIPDWVWLTEVTYDNLRIQIKGKAISNNLIAEYIDNLEDSRYFDNIEFISSTQRKVGNNQFLEFSLSANYAIPAESVSVSSAENPGKVEIK